MKKVFTTEWKLVQASSGKKRNEQLFDLDFHPVHTDEADFGLSVGGLKSDVIPKVGKNYTLTLYEAEGYDGVWFTVTSVAIADDGEKTRLDVTLLQQNDDYYTEVVFNCFTDKFYTNLHDRFYLILEEVDDNARLIDQLPNILKEDPRTEIEVTTDIRKSFIRPLP